MLLQRENKKQEESMRMKGQIRKWLTGVLSLAVCAGVFAGCDVGSDNFGKISGAFYTVEEAYEAGYLTREDLMSIAYYHNGGREYNENCMPESYQPAPMQPEEIDTATANAIKDEYIEEFRPDYEATREDIFIDHYYGCYNGAFAVIISDNFSDFPGVIDFVEIDGVTFYYPLVNYIKIWKIS